MSQQGAKTGVIPDPFRFAAEGRALGGEVAEAKLVRLVDALAEAAGSIRYSVRGTVGDDRKARLLLEASGMLQLRCQRCLGSLGWPLALETELVLVRPGESIPDEELEDDEADAIEAAPDMDVLALLEDEILLALPIAPRHEDCDAPRPEGGTGKESPFAVLARLRGSGGRE